MLVCNVGLRMKFDWTEGSLAEGLRLYESGEFFTAHEAWESVWLRVPEPEKTFLQGLIQVTAAFHHLQRDNPLGTLLLLQAALRRLERYPEEFGGSPLPCFAMTYAIACGRSKRADQHHTSLPHESDRASPTGGGWRMRIRLPDGCGIFLGSEGGISARMEGSRS